MLAAIYDVHGNLPALEAVLEDARAAGAQRFLLGGDYTTFNAWPAETLAKLEALEDATWIRGNWERWAAQDAPDMPGQDVLRGAKRFVVDALGADTTARLGALPTATVLDGVLFCHASPRSDVDAFAPSDPTRDAELLEGVEQQTVVFGHIHVQLRREATGGRTLVNPGSTGLPLDGDTRAAYALLAPDGTIELRRVEYDLQRAIDALAPIEDAWARESEQRLRRASF